MSFNYGQWSENGGAPVAKKRKRSRWGGGEEKAFIPGMPTVVPAGLTSEQEEMYLLQLQIEEISRRLRTGDLGIPSNPDDRSPSPEPIYNSDGKRLNTREYRTRKTLEEDRHKHITRAQIINVDYKPPPDYKPPIIRVNDRVVIPQELHPEINFVGLLIGPRGNTLKMLETETGAKIIIRGKGSVKEGKIGRKDGQPLPGEDEPLHAYVTASNPENVKKAVDRINDIIKQGIEVPEGQNDLRRQQLRELAQLNGTLRENDALSKLKQIQEAQNIITNTIFCSVCGGTGHLSQDCKQKRPGDTLRAQMGHQQGPPQPPVDRAKMDSEYMSLMAELGEGPPPPRHGQGHGRGSGIRQPQPFGNNQPPWSSNVGKPSFSGLALPAPQQRPPMEVRPLMSQAVGPAPGLPPPSIQPLFQQNTQPNHPPRGMMPPRFEDSRAQPMMPQQSSAPWMQQRQQPPQNSQPGVMSAPPPPPPSLMSSQSSNMPWQQQQQHMSGMAPPPPPMSSSNSAPWQNGPSHASTNMAPWQQPMQPPPVPPMGGGPPPVNSGGNHGYNSYQGYSGGCPPPPPPN